MKPAYIKPVLLHNKNIKYAMKTLYADKEIYGRSVIKRWIKDSLL